MKKPFKRVNFELQADEYLNVKIACAKQGVSMKEFINQAVKLFVEDYENKTKNENGMDQR